MFAGKTKALTWVVAILAGVLLISLWDNVRWVDALLADKTDRQGAILVKERSALLTLVYTARKRDIDLLAASNQLLAPAADDVLPRTDFLSSRLESDYSDYQAIFYVTIAESRTFIAHVDGEEVALGTEYGGFPAIRSAANAKRQCVSTAFMSSITAQHSILFASPVLVDGKVIGLIAAELSAGYFGELLSDLAAEDGSHAFLLDKQGKVIYHPEPSYPGVATVRSGHIPGLKEKGDAIMAESHGFACPSGESAPEYAYHRCLFGADNMVLVYVVPASVRNTPLRQTRTWQILSLVSAASLIIAIILCFAVGAFKLQRVDVADKTPKHHFPKRGSEER